MIWTGRGRDGQHEDAQCLALHATVAVRTDGLAQRPDRHAAVQMIRFFAARSAGSAQNDHIRGRFPHQQVGLGNHIGVQRARGIGKLLLLDKGELLRGQLERARRNRVGALCQYRNDGLALRVAAGDVDALPGLGVLL